MRRMKESSWPRLRLANNKDREKVTNLVYSILKEYSLKADPDCTDADLKDIEQSYFEKGGTFYVLEERDGSIIGAYGLCPVGKQTCELRKMYLHSAYRDKGLGKFLMESALAKARQMKFKTMILETASVLKEAICLYKSYGFVAYQPKQLSGRCNQAYIIELKQALTGRDGGI